MAASLASIRTRLTGLHPDKVALIAVSGGRDSAALLHFLVTEGWKKLIVVHLNHGLRGRSANADAKFVRMLAEEFKLRSEIKKVDVAKMAQRKKLSVETAGREARRLFFAAMAKKHRCQFIFTAHHADDQAETVLHRLCRGASLRGASGMSGVAESMPGLITVRPLLKVARAEIDGYIIRHRLKYRDDASNVSPAHTRNRVRREVLPLMSDVFRRDVRPLLVRFAELAERDDACLNSLAKLFLARYKLEQSDGSLRISAALRRQPTAILSRILQQWLAGQKIPNVGNHEIESAQAMLRSAGPVKMNLPGGAHLCCDGRRLWVQPERALTKSRAPRPRPSRRRK